MIEKKVIYDEDMFQDNVGLKKVFSGVSVEDIEEECYAGGN